MKVFRFYPALKNLVNFKVNRGKRNILVTCIVIYCSKVYTAGVGYCLFVYGFTRAFGAIND